MDREKQATIFILFLSLIYLSSRAFLSDNGMGKAYVKVVDVKPKSGESDITWKVYENASQKDFHNAVNSDPNQTKYKLSISRTIGIWVAAFFTLFILSFLYKDNPFYKIAESVVIGVSAGYSMVVGFWATIVPNLLGKLSPNWIKGWAMPGLNAQSELSYLIPLIMGIMLLWRLSPKGSWISRWPLAFIIGTTAGIRLIGFLHADFLSQIRNSIISIIILSPDSGIDFWESLKNLTIIVGVLSTIVYFFFSIEHKGYIGKTAKVGIWFLMITFGAAFGYTVMGRIALLAIRIEFLLNDWLWLIDPSNTRALM